MFSGSPPCVAHFIVVRHRSAPLFIKLFSKCYQKSNIFKVSWQQLNQFPTIQQAWDRPDNEVDLILSRAAVFIQPAT